MTTSVKVHAANHPALVEVIDGNNVTARHVLLPEAGEQTFHCTTTRTIRVTDVAFVLGAKRDEQA